MVISRAKKVLEIESRAIASMANRIDEGFVRAVELLYNCKGRVIVSGMGKSGIIAKKVASTLTSIGTPAIFLHPAEGVHGDLGMVGRGDVLIFFSKSGETDEMIKLLPIVKRFGVKLIAVTGNVTSTLARASDVVLDASVEEEACPLGIVPTASTTCALAMGDALAMALLEKRGLSEEDFAIFHPGGALGRRLLLTVTDLMHTGDATPIVGEMTPLKDIIFEISSKKLGVTTVVDGSGLIAGVITDGDLRRLMEKTNDLASVCARDFMSRSPKLISAQDLAAKALEMMERHSITSLIIVDDHKKPEGIIHLHDILKAGIV